jgi:uncharacterized protein YkwD
MNLKLIFILAAALICASFAVQAQSQVTLIEPLNDSTVVANQPQLTWSPVPNTARYVVFVRDRNGVLISRQRLNPSSVCSGSECNVYANPAITKNGRYTWQVRAVLNNKTRINSPRWTMQVIATVPRQIMYLINVKRCEAGLAPVALNRHLNLAAQAHSKDMNDNGFFSHTGSDGSNFTTRVQRAGYPGSALGENIAGGYPTSISTFTAWWNSTGHRNNMMNTSAREIGIAKRGPYWTLVTGKRSSDVLGTCP